MIIEPEDVQPIEKYDVSEFAAWLRSGFEDFGAAKAKRNAFSPLDHLVGRDMDLTRELTNIYDELSGSSKQHFREGIAMALVNMPSNFKSIPIIRSLLHLAGRVHAPEILPEAIKQIGNGYFGKMQATGEEGEQDLFALTLDIVAGMAPAYNVSDCVRNLIASSYYRPEYSPIAFVALCRSDYENFPKHLDLLRKYFYSYHLADPTYGDDTYMTALRFAQAVDLETISKKIKYIFISDSPLHHELATDNWFADALFFQSRSPLRMVKEEGDYFICRPNDIDARKIDLSEDDRAQWDHLYELKLYLDNRLRSNWSESLDLVIQRVMSNLAISYGAVKDQSLELFDRRVDKIKGIVHQFKKAASGVLHHNLKDKAA